MKYKVGDKVRVKSREWYEKNKDKEGSVRFSTQSFIEKMSFLCGNIVTISEVYNGAYGINEMDYCWTDEMFEDENHITALGPIYWKDLNSECNISFHQSFQSSSRSILSEAQYILHGDRQADYGDPVENFRRIANEASRWSGKEFSPLDCVNIMIAVKTEREKFKHKRDNLVDLAAYHEIRNMIIESEGATNGKSKD